MSMCRVIPLVAALVAVVLIPASWAFASELSVSTRLHNLSSSYWTATNCEWRVNFVDETIPWGARVFLRHGFQREDLVEGNWFASSPWNDLTVTEMSATDPYTWSTVVEKQISSRSASFRYSDLDFVFEIRLPDGSLRYVRGTSSPFGYFTAPIAVQTIYCDPWSSLFCGVETSTVEKW